MVVRVRWVGGARWAHRPIMRWAAGWRGHKVHMGGGKELGGHDAVTPIAHTHGESMRLGSDAAGRDESGTGPAHAA